MSEQTQEEASNAKKPCKGILKSSSFDKYDKFGSGSSNRKSAKFDELNVLQTYHPPNKDYGHMKVDEPKTPFNYIDPSLAEVDELDADLLAEKLKVAQETARRASIHCEESSDEEEEEEEETEEQKEKRKEFESRRKLHYNEFEAVRLARKLIEEEIDDEGDEGNDEGDKTNGEGETSKSEELQDATRKDNQTDKSSP